MPISLTCDGYADCDDRAEELVELVLTSDHIFTAFIYTKVFCLRVDLWQE